LLQLCTIDILISQMSSSSKDELSKILNGMALGGGQRAEELLPLVYEELRSLARARIAIERPGQTLQATSLVHEAYLRLVGDEDPGWSGRGHFFGAAARAMRRILVESARRKAGLKRGGDMERVDLVDEELPIEPPHQNVLAVEEALQRLEASDERKGRIVELRYFTGLTNEETARVLDLSVGTIEREWRFIKTWLQTELGEAPGE